MITTQVDYRQLDLFKPLNPIQINCASYKFSFVDLFAGIGGFRIALENLGGKCLGYSEIDQEAIRVYQSNFISYANAQEANLGDASRLDQLPFSVDLLVGGVPCQPWSIAGKLGGFTDTRGTLWFDVVRIVEKNQPKAFIWENVKGLTEPRNQISFNWIINNLRNAGYIVKYQVLNSYDFGLPQDRDRIFIVGIRQDLANAHNFTFPEPLGVNPKLYDFIDGVAHHPVTKKKFNSRILFKGKIPASRGRFQKDDELNDFFLFTDIRDGHTTIHSWDLIKTTAREKFICQTILRNRRKKNMG
jgi:DNA (cytosine-5)-methyltransferase 1